MPISSGDFSILLSSRPFTGVQAETLRALTSGVARRDFARGARVIDPAKANFSMYIVVRGELGVFADEGAVLPLTKAGPGDCVGEQSILDHGAPAALVVATKPTRVVALKAEQVWEAMYHSPLIALNLLRVLSERIRRDNARLRASFNRQVLMEKAASTDALTGLYNRRWMDDAYARELQRCSRNGLTATLLMIDIDHFKDVNDRLGHQAGDRVLAGFGQLMRKALRPRDLCARFGGEEFCALLPDVDAMDAISAAERLRSRSEAHLVRTSGGKRIRYTVSVGVAQWRPGSGLRTLIRDADRALYAAKRWGRNCVQAYQPLPPRVRRSKRRNTK